jgi:DNA-binding XRE family transcriptional regulator
MGTPISKLKARWMKDPAFAAAYDGLAEEFAIADALIAARKHARMTQAEVAERMGTSQPTIARLESGRSRPSLATLHRYAAAIGRRLVISFGSLDSATGTKTSRRNTNRGHGQPGPRVARAG